MALQRITLKISEAVAADWRARAEEQGLSVRDWLIATLGPTDPPGGAGLADRVAVLEREIAEIREALSSLQAQPPRPPQRTPAPVAPSSEMVKPAPPDGEPLPQMGEFAPITTGELALRLEVERSVLNERIHRRHGGPRVGLVLPEGWKCVGSASAATGGPHHWLWAPVSN